MTYTLKFSEQALADIQRHRKAGDVKILRKLQKLLYELREHPRRGTGKPEKLKHDFAGLYSRRISSKHRLIYSIEDQIVTVYVLSASSHYEDH